MRRLLICFAAAATVVVAAFLLVRDDDAVGESEKARPTEDPVQVVPTRQGPTTGPREHAPDHDRLRPRWPRHIQFVISETEMVTGSLTKDGTLTVTSRYEQPRGGASGLRIAAPSEVKAIVWPDRPKPSESND